jgi:ABC-type sugar transport system ATPase subunit
MLCLIQQFGNCRQKWRDLYFPNAGFVQPSSGAVRVGERAITFAPPHKRDMGIVFQNYALFPQLILAAHAWNTLSFDSRQTAKG